MPCCFLKNPLPLMYVLGLLFVSNFLGYGLISSSIIILTSILILSNLIFTFSKQTPLPEKSLLQSTKLAPVVLAEPEPEHIDQTKEMEEEFKDGQGLTTRMRDAAREMPLRQNSDPVTNIIDYEESFPSLIMHSESGRSSTSTDDSDEAEYWPYNDHGIIFRSRDNSDGSISDENSLIEISLPSGVYIDHYKEEEEKKLGFYNKQRMCLAELLSEVNYENEEDNLFEIDLSIGSIMSPRFVIHA